MIITVPYDRIEAVEYAKKWAYFRNPEFYNFQNLGGDCTNFASQCLYAGSKTMNYPSWYYYNQNDRSPSWTSVEFLYDFLIKNNSLGPRGEDVGIESVRVGDIIQLNFGNDRFEHTLVITKLEYPVTSSGIKVSAHTTDASCRPLDSYNFKKIRFIHIRDVGIEA